MTTSNPLFQQTRPYWDFLRIEKQVSPHTLSNYQRQLMAVSELFSQAGIENWEEVESSSVRWMLSQSHKQGVECEKYRLTLGGVTAMVCLFD